MQIIEHVDPLFAGNVGPVRFDGGIGETEDADTLAYFAGDPDTYTIHADGALDVQGGPGVDAQGNDDD